MASRSRKKAAMREGVEPPPRVNPPLLLLKASCVTQLQNMLRNLHSLMTNSRTWGAKARTNNGWPVHPKDKEAARFNLPGACLRVVANAEREGKLPAGLNAKTLEAYVLVTTKNDSLYRNFEQLEMASFKSPTELGRTIQTMVASAYSCVPLRSLGQVNEVAPTHRLYATLRPILVTRDTRE